MLRERHQLGRRGLREGRGGKGFKGPEPGWGYLTRATEGALRYSACGSLQMLRLDPMFRSFVELENSYSSISAQCEHNPPPGSLP